MRNLPGRRPPTWVEGVDDTGTFQFQRWADDQAMAILTATLTGEEHTVRVTIAALYEFVDEPVPSADEELRNFYGDHLDEMMPFLRQAIYTASSQVWPIAPIMMDTVALTEAAARERREQVAHTQPRQAPPLP